jgi:hypothetical protein
MLILSCPRFNGGHPLGFVAAIHSPIEPLVWFHEISLTLALVTKGKTLHSSAKSLRLRTLQQPKPALDELRANVLQQTGD